MAGFAAAMAKDGLPLPWLMPAGRDRHRTRGRRGAGTGHRDARVGGAVRALHAGDRTDRTSILDHGRPRRPCRAAINFYKNIGMAGGFLLLSVTGGGRFAIDALALTPWRTRPAT